MYLSPSGRPVSGRVRCLPLFAPMVVNLILHSIQVLRTRGTTVLLVEQNAKAALKIADRGYVLETGRIILEGETKDLLDNKEVQRAYLGKEYREVWQ